MPSTLSNFASLFKVKENESAASVVTLSWSWWCRTTGGDAGSVVITVFAGMVDG